MENGIDINIEGIGTCLQQFKLVVPSYQRSYAWEEKQVTELLQDLDAAILKKEKEYFLGSIVVKKIADKTFEVVDGQQRLATISIFIASLRDYYVNVDNELAKDLTREYLYSSDKYDRTNVVQHLKLNNKDNDYYYTSILISNTAKENNSKPVQQRLRTAKELTTKKVLDISRGPLGSEMLKRWEQYIETQLKVMLVVVPDYSNAFMIFETLNDRGLDLAVSDLLKNYLFNLAPDKRLEEIQYKWTSMCSILESADTKVVQYIRYLWASLYGSVPEKKLYEHIKAEIQNSNSAFLFSEKLENNASLYVAILNSENIFWKEMGDTTCNNIRTINMLGMVQIRPLLLAMMEMFSKKEISKCLPDFISMIVRLQLSGNVSSGTFETQFSDAARLVRTGEIQNKKHLFSKLKNIIPNDEKFKDYFSVASVSKPQFAKYILTEIEKQMINIPDSEIAPETNSDIVNIEHIMPKKLSEEWKRNFSQDESDQWTYHIGNQTLLKVKKNSLLGNKSFKDKKITYEKSDFLITRDLIKYDSWDFNKIKQRQAEFAEYALKAWPIKC